MSDAKITLVQFTDEINIQAVMACRREMSTAALGYRVSESFNAAMMIALGDMANMGFSKENAIATLAKWAEANVTEENIKALTPTDEKRAETLKAHPLKVQRS